MPRGVHGAKVDDIPPVSIRLRNKVRSFEIMKKADNYKMKELGPSTKPSKLAFGKGTLVSTSY